jgi:hypothetical protein
MAFLALVLALLSGPLFHVHTGMGHDPDHEGVHRVRVHSHLLAARTGEGDRTDPGFEMPSHDGTSVDLFLSLTGKQVNVVVQAELDPELIPRLQASRQRGTYRFDRTHDPPDRNLSPRAPPA